MNDVQNVQSSQYITDAVYLPIMELNNSAKCWKLIEHGKRHPNEINITNVQHRINPICLLCHINGCSALDAYKCD